MRRSEGLVFPSKCLESFPLVYAEAMAAGLPVLAWTPNVVADMTRLDGTGMAISWQDDLPSALRTARSAFPALRERCRHLFEERMSERAHVARAEALYRQLVG
jgi:glycosyltransferase involved in cell wall biosynthesis